MKREGISVPGFTLDNAGKLVRSHKGVSVSKRIARVKSKKRKVVARPFGGTGPSYI